MQINMTVNGKMFLQRLALRRLSLVGPVSWRNIVRRTQQGIEWGSLS
jgi:hypothetical protein